jgi:hypothetical protein
LTRISVSAPADPDMPRQASTGRDRWALFLGSLGELHTGRIEQLRVGKQVKAHRRKDMGRLYHGLPTDAHAAAGGAA